MGFPAEKELHAQAPDVGILRGTRRAPGGAEGRVPSSHQEDRKCCLLSICQEALLVPGLCFLWEWIVTPLPGLGLQLGVSPPETQPVNVRKVL